MKGRTGFTLLELSMVAALTILFTAVAAPLFLRSLSWWQLNAAAHTMAGDVRRWQERAVIEQISGLKIVINKQEKKYLLKEGITIREVHELHGLIASLDVSPTTFSTVEFYPSGMTGSAGNFALGDRFGRFKYIVILNTTGRIRISDQPAN